MEHPHILLLDKYVGALLFKRYQQDELYRTDFSNFGFNLTYSFQCSDLRTASSQKSRLRKNWYVSELTLVHPL